MKISRWRRLLLPVLLGVTLSACTAPTAAPPTAPDNEARTAAYLQQIRDRPPYLDAFLRRMPKGGDLHSHLSGAVYAESYVRWAAADGLCFDRNELKLVAPQKKGGPLGNAARYASAFSAARRTSSPTGSSPIVQ